MTLQSANPPSVYTGVWTDWTYGRVAGGTITMSSQSGALVVAFLALFVRMAGNHLWDIICFSIFWVRSSRSSVNDGLWHQQQALLRNKQTDGTFAFEMLRTGWAWRRVVPRAAWRSLPLIITAVLHAGAFVTAAIFSSKVTSAQSYVLLNEVSCGTYSTYNLDPKPADLQHYVDFGANVRKDFLTAANYAASCYGTSLSNTSWEDCNALGREQLQWSVQTDIACPFDSQMCAGGLAVRLDSGLIDSHLQLGINAPKSDRIGYRQVLECAPIVQEGFVKGPLTKSGLDPGYTPDIPYETWYEYHYGQSGIWPATFMTGNDSFLWQPGQLTQWSDYELSLNIFYPQVLEDTAVDSFKPIVQLNRSDADVLLVALAASAWAPVMFRTPVYDPWFNATSPFIDEFEEQTDHGVVFFNTTWYTTSNPLNILGCAVQYQWCNTGLSHGPKCTPLGGTRDTSALYESAKTQLDLNAYQVATLERMDYITAYSELHFALDYLGSDILLAHQMPYHSLSPGLPDDQWIKEVSQIFATGLVSMQLQTLEWVTGDGNPAHNHYQEPPTTEAGKRMCRNQIAQTPHYASFNILGLCIIFIFGGLFVLINFFIDTALTANVRRFKPLNEDRRMDWISYSALQMQRMAFESRGLGIPWSGQRDIVPVAANNHPWPSLGLVTNRPEKPVEHRDGRHGRHAAGQAAPQDNEHLSYDNDFKDELPQTSPPPPPPVSNTRWPAALARFWRRPAHPFGRTGDVESTAPPSPPPLHLHRQATSSSESTKAEAEAEEPRFKTDDFREELPPTTSDEAMRDPGRYPSRIKIWRRSDRVVN